jgi:hypothetical protein
MFTYFIKYAPEFKYTYCQIKIKFRECLQWEIFGHNTEEVTNRKAEKIHTKELHELY